MIALTGSKLEHISLKPEFAGSENTVTNNGGGTDFVEAEIFFSDIDESGYAQVDFSQLIGITMEAYSLSSLVTTANQSSNVAVINGQRYKEGDYLSLFESDLNIVSIIDDRVYLYGSLVLNEMEEKMYLLVLGEDKMQEIYEFVDVQAPSDWLEWELSQSKL